jgi:aminopeptidase N
MLQFYFDDHDDPRSFELPGAKPHYNPDRPGQVEHIALNLALNIPQQSYEGTCSIRLKPVRNGISSLTLDAVSLNIKSVKVDKNKLSFEYDGEQLNIKLNEPTQVDQPFTIAIAYSVEKPQRGIYFVGPDQNDPHKPVQVWTQGEDEDSRFWFPCFDYPGQLATSEIKIKVPQQFMAISNGELIAVKEEGESKIYHWYQKEVHPTYLMTLAVGDFAEIKDEWQGKSVTYYVEKNRQEDARRSMGKTPQMISFFSEIFGYAYPYPKYAQVCVADFIFGGMENTSTTLLTDRCLLDERAALDDQRTETLVAHELAHQWFGDLVVIKHWSHAWLKEGMATYAEVLWTDHEYGADAAAYYRLNEARNYFSEDKNRYRRPIVTHVYREAIELYDRHLYEKGACVYHMIRAELGDELFFKAIATFVQDNAHKTVETTDLLRAIEKSTGKNLLFLFDQYVYRGGHPDYKVAYSWDSNNSFAKITVTQTQVKSDKKNPHPHKELFDLKIPIAFGYVHETEGVKLTTFTVRIHEREQSFYFPLPEKPRFISFDAGNHYLKTVQLDYPVAELKEQLKLDPDPISRIYAAEALAVGPKKNGGNLEAVKALAEALKQEPFWGVRLEVAKNLGKIKLDQAFDALVAGLEDENPWVRRSVVEALGTIKTAESYKALKPIVEKGDRSYYVEAAANKAIGSIAAAKLDEKPKESRVIKLLKTVLEERAGWNEVVRNGAIAGLSELKTSEEALNIILHYSQAEVPQPLRLGAIRALGTISTGQNAPALERILERLSELSAETFFLTQVAVVTALGQMETPKAIGILQSLADQTPDGRVRRIAEEAVRKVEKKIGSDKALKQLRDELQELKKQNQELRSRLETLEAKSQ